MKRTSDRSDQQNWEPGFVRASDGSLWLRVAVPHYRWITERSYRRAVLRELRTICRRDPELHLDLYVACRADGGCCRIESMDQTERRITGALQDWTGADMAGSIDHYRYERLRAAGLPVCLSDGASLP